VTASPTPGPITARVLHRPTPADAWLPEGPRLLGQHSFSWITIQRGANASHGALHVFRTQRGENRSWRLPGRPGFAIPTPREGVFLLGMERSLGLYDTAAARFSPLATGIDQHTDGTIINDAALCRDGVVFGCKDTEFRTPKAGLWFWRSNDRQLFCLRRDQLCSNGKILRPLGTGRYELFDIDSPTRVIVRSELDVASGTLSPPKIAVDLRHERAVPDGCVLLPGSDEALVAMFDPGPLPDDEPVRGRVLRCHLRRGTVLGAIHTPGAAQVTCPALVQTQHGPQVVMTTAAEGLGEEALRAQPNAGCLFLAPLPGQLVAEPEYWAEPRS
jgi:sugar lactone lactonase YvrE